MCRTYRRDFASNLQYKFKGKLWRRCPICQNVISNQHIHNRGPVLLSEIMSSHVDSMHLHCYLYVMMWNVKKGTCLVNFVINFNLFKSGLKHNIKILLSATSKEQWHQFKERSTGTRLQFKNKLFAMHNILLKNKQ